MKSLNLTISVFDEDGQEYLIKQEDEFQKDILISQHKQNMYIDSVFLPDIVYWLANNNIIDNGNIRYRNKKHPTLIFEHNNFVWDAFAYTKTTGLLNEKIYKNNKKTLVVIDSIISRKYNSDDLNGFLDRIQILLNNSQSRRILPIIITQEIQRDLLKNIKRLNIIHFNIGSIFGEKIYEILRGLEYINKSTIENCSDGDDVLEVIKKIFNTVEQTGQSGQLNNIKGDLFEVLMIELIKRIYSNSSVGHSIVKKSSDSKEAYEYDIVVQSPETNECIVFEVKGYSPNTQIKLGDQNTKNTLKWFFKRTFPFYKQNDQDNIGKVHRACYITTSKIDNEGIDFLEEHSTGRLKPKKMDLYYDGQKLMNYVKDNDYTLVYTMLKKNFTK